MNFIYLNKTNRFKKIIQEFRFFKSDKFSSHLLSIKSDCFDKTNRTNSKRLNILFSPTLCPFKLTKQIAVIVSSPVENKNSYCILDDFYMISNRMNKLLSLKKGSKSYKLFFKGTKNSTILILKRDVFLQKIVSFSVTKKEPLRIKTQIQGKSHFTKSRVPNLIFYPIFDFYHSKDYRNFFQDDRVLCSNSEKKLTILNNLIFNQISFEYKLGFLEDEQLQTLLYSKKYIDQILDKRKFSFFTTHFSSFDIRKKSFIKKSFKKHRSTETFDRLSSSNKVQSNLNQISNKRNSRPESTTGSLIQENSFLSKQLTDSDIKDIKKRKRIKGILHSNKSFLRKEFLVKLLIKISKFDKRKILDFENFDLSNSCFYHKEVLENKKEKKEIVASKKLLCLLSFFRNGQTFLNLKSWFLIRNNYNQESCYWEKNLNNPDAYSYFNKNINDILYSVFREIKNEPKFLLYNKISSYFLKLTVKMLTEKTRNFTFYESKPYMKQFWISFLNFKGNISILIKTAWQNVSLNTIYSPSYFKKKIFLLKKLQKKLITSCWISFFKWIESKNSSQIMNSKHKSIAQNIKHFFTKSADSTFSFFFSQNSRTKKNHCSYLEKWILKYLLNEKFIQNWANILQFDFLKNESTASLIEHFRQESVVSYLSKEYRNDYKKEFLFNSFQTKKNKRNKEKVLFFNILAQFLLTNLFFENKDFLIKLELSHLTNLSHISLFNKSNSIPLKKACFYTTISCQKKFFLNQLSEKKDINLDFDNIFFSPICRSCFFIKQTTFCSKKRTLFVFSSSLIQSVDFFLILHLNFKVLLSIEKWMNVFLPFYGIELASEKRELLTSVSFKDMVFYQQFGRNLFSPALTDFATKKKSMYLFDKRDYKSALTKISKSSAISFLDFLPKWCQFNQQNKSSLKKNGVNLFGFSVFQFLKTNQKMNKDLLSQLNTSLFWRKSLENFFLLNSKQIHTLLLPSSSAVQNHLTKIKQIIQSSKAKTQLELINQLAPIIQNWKNYYTYTIQKQIQIQKINRYCDYLTFKMLWRWCCRRHTNKSNRWIKQKYFHQIYSSNWIFGVFDSTLSSFICLPNHTDRLIDDKKDTEARND